MRRLLAVCLVACAWGCVKPSAKPSAKPSVKPAAPASSALGQAVRVVAVIDSFESAEVVAAPRSVVAELEGVLRERQLEPVEVDPSGWLESFTALRSTEARIQHLAPPGGSWTPVLLVEVAPRFGAQVNGRYRWVVEGTVTAHGSATRSETFRAPVHLLYSHQGEKDALLEASPVVATRVGRLVREWVELLLSQVDDGGSG